MIAQTPDWDALDSYAKQAVGDWRVPGLAIAVIKDGETVFAKGYGELTLGGGRPVNENSLFAIGSTTKAMTSAAIGMLVDEGKLDWDDPVIEHLPDFRVADPYVTRELTIRDLLTHRGGLGNADFLWYGTSNSRSEIIRRLRWVEPAYSLRSSFIYQNIMYATAGAVIEAKSGMTWEGFIQTRLLDPLGMTHSVTLLEHTASRPNVAAPHYILDDEVEVITNASVDNVAAAGSIWSGVGDMAKWIGFMLDSGRVAGTRLLEPDTWAELLEPQTLVPPGQFYPTSRLTKPHWTSYALGWFQHDYDGRAVSFHTGSIDGMVAIAGMIPDEGIGVYVLANLDHAEVRHALMYRVFDMFDDNTDRDWSAELLEMYGEMRAQGIAARKRARKSRVENTAPSLSLDAYTGTYTDSLWGEVTISMVQGALHLTADQLEGDLEHWQYDTFTVRWAKAWMGTGRASFRLNSAGRASTLVFRGRELRRSD